MIYLAIVAVILYLVYRVLIMIGDYLIFHPQIATGNREDYTKLIQTMNGHDDMLDNIHYVLFNKSDCDTLFIFAHGNAGNILDRHDSSQIRFMRDFGSVLLFDYGGFGYSRGVVSEAGMKADILKIYDHFEDKYTKIVLFGESLGCSCVSWLAYHLHTTGRKLPTAVILQSGFYSIREMCRQLFGEFLVYLIMHDFDNRKYLESIRGQCPVLILHSRADEVINYTQAEKLAAETGNQLYEITGSHNNPVFNDTVHNAVRDILRSPKI